MPEEEKIKLICNMAATMFPAIYENRRAISHDTYNEIEKLTAATAIVLFHEVNQRINE
jgi:hypothetical protein